MIDMCIWRFNEDTGKYDAGCGSEFYFTDGDADDNGFDYCPFCGEYIKELDAV